MTTIREDGTVEFRFYRPGVHHVRLAGDFCQWTHRPIEMLSSGDGWWTAQIKLEAGEYRFRYIADGQWFTDYAAHGIEVCEVGWNSVLLILAKDNANLEETESRFNKTMAKSAA